MSGDDENVHVVYGLGRAETVREVLRMKGRSERVVALTRALNVGPIASADPEVRRAWMRANWGEDPDRSWQEPDEPWSEITADGVHPTVWVCRTDAGELASFLEFATRMNGRAFDIVDVTDAGVEAPDGVSPVWSLGMMRPEDIVASGVVDSRRPVSAEESREVMAAWSRLKEDNADLRIVRDKRLVSAPPMHFDAVLSDQASSEWQVAASLIGRTLHHLSSEADPPGQSTHDGFLFGRILALGNAGVLEVRGKGTGMRDYDVRKPPRHPQC